MDHGEILIHAPYGCEIETRKSPSYRWSCSNRGSTPFVIFQSTLKGAGCFQNKSSNYSIGAGKALVSIIPEDAHYYYPPSATEPWVFSWINFEGPLAMTLWKKMRDEFGPILEMPPESESSWDFARLVQTAARRKFRSPWEEAEMSYRFFLACHEQQQKIRDETRTSMRSIAEYYRSRNHERITVKEMAERSGLSREHFTRTFQNEMAISPANYLRKLRIDRAATLLERTDLTVTEIAHDSGFSSPRQLSKTFSHFKGLSPLRHRQKQKSQETS